jgi:hypothetical protein
MVDPLGQNNPYLLFCLLLLLLCFILDAVSYQTFALRLLRSSIYVLYLSPSISTNNNISPKAPCWSLQKVPETVPKLPCDTERPHVIVLLRHSIQVSECMGS